MNYKVALAGNPNVGKSTLFNTLTGLHQHTGNWVGKTVETARGKCTINENEFDLIDLPGTYSMFPKSDEEQCAVDYLCNESLDAVIVVCDAGSLYKGLVLLLQILQITTKAIVALNMCSSAEKHGIKISDTELERILGVPVVRISARKRRACLNLLQNIPELKDKDTALQMEYSGFISSGLNEMERIHPNLSKWNNILKLIHVLDEAVSDSKIYSFLLDEANRHGYMNSSSIESQIALQISLKASEIINKVTIKNAQCNRAQTADEIFLNSKIGILILVLFLSAILYLTIYGANVPSDILFRMFGRMESGLAVILSRTILPECVQNALVYGMFRTLSWVLSVMVPPMAIFFPLFTLLEDCGVLPRIAFQMDHYFQNADSNGKQALIMCMGLGCNAVGVTGCRIMGFGKDRIIAALTNSFVPCNGRLPMLIAIITAFFCVGTYGTFNCALMMTAILVFSVILTLISSKLLSKTVLKGEKAQFVLELPCYRVPQFGQVIIRSFVDRTLKVAWRASIIAAPAGLIIWILSNVGFHGKPLLEFLSNAMEPVGKILGMDGVVLTAFILALPANEIVLPAIFLGYNSGSALNAVSSLSEVKSLLVLNGWTTETALCFMIFSLFHWPCATTIWTIKKETGSLKWTLLSILLPVSIGVILCFCVHMLFTIL